jgi:hypothetical protein
MGGTMSKDLVKQEAHISTRLELAAHLHQQVALGVFVTATALKRIRDERLYEELGFETFGDYIGAIPVSRTQVYLNIKIADKFDKFLPQGSGENVPPWDNFENFGMRKLGALVKLDDPDFEEIIGGGAVQVNGNDFTMQDFAIMKATEVEGVLIDYKRKTSKKISLLEENLKLEKSERKQDKDKIAELEENIQAQKDLEILYGARASTLESKRRSLELARKYFDLANQYFQQSNILEDDPVAMRREAAQIIQNIDMMHKNASTNYGFTQEAE